MYGNFDGIKNRAKLRKEVNNLRLERLGKRKKGQTNSIKNNVFSSISKERLQEAKKNIKEKLRKDNLILVFMVILASSFVIWRYLIPFIF